MSTAKSRLDELLVAHGLTGSRAESETLIRAGKVYVNEYVVDKPGQLCARDAIIRVKQAPAYASRGGLKLEKGLDYFTIDPTAWTCADVGASTGGFTDCLLQRGAARVYAIDVAYGQLHWKLRTDDRVVVLERTNVRALDAKQIDRPLELAVFDTSFISLTKVIPPLLPCFGKETRILALVKPQFELPPERVGKGGIVVLEEDRLEAVRTVETFGLALGLRCPGYTESPITGAKGNREYLIYFEGG